MDTFKFFDSEITVIAIPIGTSKRLHAELIEMDGIGKKSLNEEQVADTIGILFVTAAKFLLEYYGIDKPFDEINEVLTFDEVLPFFVAVLSCNKANFYMSRLRTLVKVLSAQMELAGQIDDMTVDELIAKAKEIPT